MNIRLQFPPIRRRQFLAPDFDPENPVDVDEVLQRLLEQPPQDFRSAHEWFGLFHEASLAIMDMHAILEIATHRNFSDQDAEARLRRFDAEVLSRLLRTRAQLMDLYLESPWKAAMHSDDHGRIAQDFACRRRYATPDLADLQLEENELVRQYRKLTGQATTVFDGRETLLSVVVSYQHDARAAMRKEAFLSYWGFLYEHEEKLQDLFQRLLKNRRAQAHCVGQDTYVPLGFAELGRIDYGAEECARLRDAIESVVVPALSRLSQRQAEAHRTTTLRPWDAPVWPSILPVNPPAGGNLHSLVLTLGRIAGRIHPHLAHLHETMLAANLIDVHPLRDKSPGAFCVTLQESGMPYIFGNFAGNYKDAFTLIHEFGHAVHGHAASYVPNVLLRTPGLEFCEVASIGLEFLASHHFEELWYDASDVLRARGVQIFTALVFWPFMAMIDGWQHSVYNDPNSNAESRDRTWKELSRRFRPQIDWSGYEHFEQLGWLSRPHVFSSPFYYVDYGIAQLGAVQLLRSYRQSPGETCEKFLHALGLGAQRSLPELFATAGLALDFSPRLLGDLTGFLVAELEAILAAVRS